MRLAIEWSRVCDADVLRMRYKVAERVCMAVMRFAEGGSVQVERVRTGDLSLLRVRAPGGAALVRIDAGARRILVLRIFPTQ